jgi:hypothetical protein
MLLLQRAEHVGRRHASPRAEKDGVPAKSAGRLQRKSDDALLPFSGCIHYRGSKRTPATGERCFTTGWSCNLPAYT